MLLNIIFSFNRAMQLDYLLKSTLKNFKLDYKIIVIYHTSGKHSNGYNKLIYDYRNYPEQLMAVDANHQLKIVKSFHYEDFKRRLS
jgi:hypothetical protein